MFEKVKGFLLMVAGAVIGFLALLLGVRKRKIEKLESENKVQSVTIKVVEKARDAENANAVKMTEKATETSESLQDVSEGRKSYNDVVKDWNEGN